MRRPQLNPQGLEPSLFWDLLTFDKLLANSVIHLLYWAGLGLISLAAFGTIGAAVGVALREATWLGILLAIPVLVGGMLVVAGLALIWRGFCEFYVTIFKISDDLRALRLLADAEGRTGPAPGGKA